MNGAHSGQHAAAISFDTGRRDTGSSVGVAPLVDIVLLLICFYLLVSSSIQSYQNRAIQLPRMRNQRLVSQQPAELVVNVPRQGPLSLNGRSVGFEELADRLRGLTRGAGAGGGESAAGGDAPLRVVIRADRRQVYDRLHRVLAVCREVDLPRILLRVREPGR